MNVAGDADSPAGTGTGSALRTDVLLGIEMTGIKHGHTTRGGVFQKGRIMGGDSIFYYTASIFTIRVAPPTSMVPRWGNNSIPFPGD